MPLLSTETATVPLCTTAEAASVTWQRQDDSSVVPGEAIEDQPVELAEGAFATVAAPPLRRCHA